MKKTNEILIVIGITVCVLSVLIPINKDIISNNILRNILYSRGILIGLLISSFGCFKYFKGTIKNISLSLGGGVFGILLISSINIIHGGLDADKYIFNPEIYYLRFIQFVFTILFIILIIKICSKIIIPYFRH